MVQDFLIVKNLKLFTFSQYENHTSSRGKKWVVGSRKFQTLFFLAISTHFSIFIKSGVLNLYFSYKNQFYVIYKQINVSSIYCYWLLLRERCCYMTVEAILAISILDIVIKTFMVTYLAIKVFG